MIDFNIIVEKINDLYSERLVNASLINDGFAIIRYDKLNDIIMTRANGDDILLSSGRERVTVCREHSAIIAGIVAEWLETGYLSETESPVFKHGYDVGESIGETRAIDMVRRAYDMGEIELFIEAMSPKTMDEWEEWENEHGKSFSYRWRD